MREGGRFWRLWGAEGVRFIDSHSGFEFDETVAVIQRAMTVRNRKTEALVASTLGLSGSPWGQGPLLAASVTSLIPTLR
jgi:hypothetical protein